MSSISRRRVAKFVAGQLVAGESPTRVAKVLAAYLISNRQKRQAELLLRDVETELLRGHGHLAAEISSARELSREIRLSLIEMLKSETGAGTVELMESVDRNLVGGVVVRTPEAELDATLLNKLRKLRAV